MRKHNPTEAEVDVAMNGLVQRPPPVIEALKAFDPAKGAEMEARFDAARTDATAAKVRGNETDYILKTWGVSHVFDDILKYTEAAEPEMEALADRIEQVLDDVSEPDDGTPGVR